MSAARSWATCLAPRIVIGYETGAIDALKSVAANAAESGLSASSKIVIAPISHSIRPFAEAPRCNPTLCSARSVASIALANAKKSKVATESQ